MAIVIALALLYAQPAAASAARSTAALRRTQALQRANYVVRAVCKTQARGRARCLALKLVPRSAAPGEGTRTSTAQTTSPSPAAPSPAAGEFGLRPQDLHSAYLLPTSAPDAQTIALVDAYNDPTAEADLARYSDEFGLPACTVANECFKQVNQEGETGNPPFPKTVKELESALKDGKRAEAEEAIGWSVEISLDIETARAVCQNCHIVLVEANSPTYANLEAAENAAAAHTGATEISNSWGGPECAVVGDCASGSAFDHAGIVITAAAGDEGYLDWLEESGPSFADFPATSPQVVAVGGTRLALGPDGEWAGESVWNDGGEREGEKEGYGATGGGCSAQFTAPAWQQALADWSQVGCEDKRAVSDVSADADPYSGVAVYDSLEECAYLDDKALRYSHWCTIGGTSLATPLIAATFALAGGADGVEYPAKTLYENAASAAGSLHDVTEGSNGECLKPFDEETGVSGCTAAEEAKTSCSSKAICLAGSGYDGPTGLGTPDGTSAFALHGKPTASTGTASRVTQTSATLDASVDPNGVEVSECRFEYGPSSVSEASAPCVPTPGAGTRAEQVSAQVSALRANTSYVFRVVAKNADGTSVGETQTFTTLPDAPTVTAGSPLPVLEATSATVYAQVNPNGGDVSECTFEYALETGIRGPYEASAPCTPAPGSGSAPVQVSASLTGLEPDTAYRYRVVATNTGGSGEAEQTFTTLASRPTVRTGMATEVTQTSATLGGTVNPNGVEVSVCKIEYGTSTAYGSTATCTPPPGAGSSPTAVSASITGLSAGTNYYFRVSATNATGTEYGAEQTFTTLPDPPTVTTGSPAPTLGYTTATVYAQVNPNGGDVSECTFEYALEAGIRGPYEASAPCTPAPGSGSAPVQVSASLTELAPDTAYRYRVVATNPGGGGSGEGTFTTLPSAPTVTTGKATAITQTTATLAGSVDPNGETVSACEIEYGTTTAYGSTAVCASLPGAGESPISVSASITGLSAGANYYFRVSATNATGTEYGAEQSFTTELPAMPEPLPLGQEPSSAQQTVLATHSESPPRVPDARLASTSLTASATGMVSVSVRCPTSETSCTGTVTLRTLSAVLFSTDAKTHRAAVLTLASGSFLVAGGHVTTVKLRLSGRAQALLLRKHPLRARATVFARDPAGATHTTLELVRIRAGRPAAARRS